MLMLEKVPAAFAVPHKRPVTGSKLHQYGRFAIQNLVIVVPSGSEALGVKLDAPLSAMVVGGVLEITGIAALLAIDTSIIAPANSETAHARNRRASKVAIDIEQPPRDLTIASVLTLLVSARRARALLSSEVRRLY